MEVHWVAASEPLLTGKSGVGDTAALLEMAATVGVGKALVPWGGMEPVALPPPPPPLSPPLLPVMVGEREAEGRLGVGKAEGEVLGEEVEVPSPAPAAKRWGVKEGAKEGLSPPDTEGKGEREAEEEG